MKDAGTTVQSLKDLLRAFRDERDWAQFHNPKDVAEAIVVEAGELLELFLWKTKEEVAKKLEDPTFREKVQDELADVMAFTLNFANATGIDLAEAVERKVAKNAAKYPVEKSKGSSAKYTEL